MGCKPNITQPNGNALGENKIENYLKLNSEVRIFGLLRHCVPRNDVLFTLIIIIARAKTEGTSNIKHRKQMLQKISNFLKFRVKMKFYVFKIILCHLQNILRISEKHISPVFVFCQILCFSAFEILKFCRIIALNPACLIKRD